MRRLGIATLVILAFATVPFWADNYVLRLATFVCMQAALAMGWNIIGGYAGYPSFATAGFFGLGAYAGALLQNAGIALPVAWLFGGLAAGFVAAALGTGVLRMRGHYFAVASIAIVEVFRLLASSWAGLTGGGGGLNVRVLAGGPDYAGRVFFAAMLVVMAATLLGVLWLDRSRLGFALRCIAQNEDAADMAGVDTEQSKGRAFALSALPCGAVGAIYASWSAYLDPTEAFSILLTLKAPVMAMLGGVGTVFGPLLGAFAFTVVEEMVWSRFLEWNRAILGGIVVALVIFLPGGLLRLPPALRRRVAR